MNQQCLCCVATFQYFHLSSCMNVLFFSHQLQIPFIIIIYLIRVFFVCVCFSILNLSIFSQAVFSYMIISQKFSPFICQEGSAFFLLVSLPRSSSSLHTGVVFSRFFPNHYGNHKIVFYFLVCIATTSQCLDSRNFVRVVLLL